MSEKSENGKSEDSIKEHKHEMPFGELIASITQPEEVQHARMNPFEPKPESAAAEEAKDNDAHEELFNLLTKIGASSETLERVLGIEPKAKREARQADDRAWKEKMRKDWEQGQDFDKTERERLAKEAEEKAKKEKAASDNSAKEKPTAVGTVTATIKSNTGKSMLVDYANTTSAAATAKVRIGSSDRPDRIIPAGKVVTSTYTTTVKTGFTGQRLLVGHVEAGVTILDKVL